jgi:hypothetical protein
MAKISKGLNSDKAARPVIRRIAFRWLRIGLTGAVCLGLALVLARWMLGHVAIGQISRLTQSKVQTKSVNVGVDGSVLIEQLVLKPIRQEPDDYAIFKAETVHGRFSIGTLFRLRPRLDEVEISDFVLDARYNLETGRWNTADFLMDAPKSGSAKLPLISLKNGKLMYSKVSNGQVQGVAVVPIDATLGPAGSEQGRYRYDIETAEGPWGFGKSRLTGFWRPGHVTIAGSFSSADIAAFEKVWRVYVVAAELEYDYDRSYSLKLVLRNLENEHKLVGDKPVAPEPAFLRNLGTGSTLQRFFARFDPRGRIDIELEAAGSLDHLAKSSLSGTVICRDVSICDRRFPYSVKHITGPIEITENSAELKSLSGKHGPVELTFNGRFRAGPQKEYDIRVGSKNMALDQDLYKALNARYKRWWSSCSPSGAAEVDYRWVRGSDGSRKQTLAVKPLGAEAVYERFPYPLSNLTGELSFDSEGVTFTDVVSQYGPRRITINGKIANHNAEGVLCDLSIDAQDIPLDATLAACLSQRQRRLYDQLNIRGLADAEVKVLTPKESTAGLAIEADIHVKKASLKPDYLPLAVSDASGRVLTTGDSIHIENFKGKASSGIVSVAGGVRPGAEPNELQYDLVLQGKQVELDEGLLSLLPPSLKAAVSGFEPKGKVNYTAELNKEAGLAQPDYRISVDCLGNSFNLASFPYPLENVRGTVSIATTDMGDGSVATIGDAAIPQGSRAVCVEGQLSQVNGESAGQRFDLELEKLWVFAAEDGRQYVDLGALAVFSNCDLKPSTAVTDLDAVLKVNGLYEIGKGFLGGQGLLKADCLRIAGNHLTELTADIDYDRTQACWLSENLKAACYRGRVAGRLEFKLTAPDTSQYLLQVCFDNVDLAEFLAEREDQSGHGAMVTGGGITADHNAVSPGMHAASEMDAPKHTSGRMGGSLSVRGRIGDDYSRIGRCRLIMSDVQVGRMSPLAKVLCVLRLTEPTDFAFDRVLVDSYIRQNGVLFEHLDLSGQSLAFNGSGQMDLQNHNLDLVLFARGQRLATAEPSILQSLTEGVGHALVRLEVTGNYREPKVTTTALPVIGETLGILGTRSATPH